MVGLVQFRMRAGGVNLQTRGRRCRSNLDLERVRLCTILRYTLYIYNREHQRDNICLSQRLGYPYQAERTIADPLLLNSIDANLDRH